ncbi:MAG TPA: ATP-binding protein [Verrucomicrobiales bacterium]|nr:ATP-binding protein [Verrucomicrobiales bacterium]
MSLRLQDRIAAVQTARDVRRHVSNIATALREAEAAQRMYVITGEEAHLAPLTGAQESLPKRWNSVSKLADRMPDFSPDVPPLARESKDALDALQTIADLRRKEGRDAAIARVVTGQSYQTLVAMHEKLEAIMEQLEQQIGEETRSLGQAEGRGRVAALSTGLVALGLGMLGVWQWRQSLLHYRRELNLQAEKSRAEQMAQDKSDFLAAMSHEVRTPLNAILGMSEQLRDTVSEGPAAQQAEAINEAGRGMLRLVNDLLDLSRMEAGRLELHRSAVYVGTQLEWLLSLFSPQAGERGIQLAVSSANDLPVSVWLDEVRFRQILINLVSNALKFTKAGGRVSVRLERSENASGSELVVEVRDSGCGIRPELQTVVFQPYVQGLTENRTSSESGTGLGLAIVKELVLLMQGNISLQSQPGVGTTFRITLPLIVPPSDALPSAPSPARRTGAPVVPDSTPPAGPLAEEHANRLIQILQNKYATAAATQSTSDVSALADALDRLAQDARCSLLAAAAEDLRRSSRSFALTTLSRNLDGLPQRFAPLLAALPSSPPVPAVP